MKSGKRIGTRIGIGSVIGIGWLAALAVAEPLGSPASPKSVSSPISSPIPLPSPSPRGAMTLEPGETIMSLATRLYGDPGYWRALHAVNPKVSVEQPITPGTKLKLFPGKPIDLSLVSAGCFDESFLYCSQTEAKAPLDHCLRKHAEKLGDTCRDEVLPCRKFEKKLCAAESGTALTICMKKHAMDLSEACVHSLEMP